jgi:hypothetical protein
MYSYTLSIDIAIKNLAFCLFNNSKIIDWKLINLIQDDIISTNIICSALTKKNIKCDKIAKFCQDGNSCQDVNSCQDGKKYYCKMHAKGQNNIIEMKDKLICSYNKCNKEILYYYKDNKNKLNGLCNLHKKTISKDIEIIRYYTTKNITDNEVRILLFKELDKYEFTKIDIGKILIEKQPKKATEKMRSLAYAVYDYFIIKFNYNPKVKIIWGDPKNKLTVYNGPIIKCPDEIKDQYDKNKWYACKYCIWYLETRGETDYLNFLLLNKKQDDLADCYLQGIYYIENKNKKKPLTLQQQVVYSDQNLTKLKKIRSIKPKSTLSKNYSLSNIKYLLLNNDIDKLNINDKFLNNLKYFFGEYCIFDNYIFQNGKLIRKSIDNKPIESKKIQLIKK